MLFRHRLRKLLPQQLGGQCLLALVLGAIAALVLGDRSQWLMPLGDIFLRASQVVVMPYLICELIGALGALRTQSLQVFLRSGALVILLTLLMGAAMVLVLPVFLPPLLYSAFFSPEVLTPAPDPDLIATYLPYNIFSALAEDNFPAVVVFSAVMGIALQGMPERQVLLHPLEQLRTLFGYLNKWVARITPLGIFALSANTLSSLRPDDLIRMQGLLVICLVGFLVLTLLIIGLLRSLTPLTLQELWLIIRGPLAITASSANLLIALPMLNENLKQVLRTRLGDGDPERLQVAGEEVSALVPIGFALPTLGKVMTLIFIPFVAWYVDRPMDTGAILRMLATGIPTVVGGLKAAVRLELQRLGLPENLLQLVYLNGEWLYRMEKVLALEGLVFLALLVVCQSTGLLRLRGGAVLLTGLLTVATTLGLGFATRGLLARTLEGSYRNDQVLLALQPTVPTRQPVRTLPPIRSLDPATLARLPIQPVTLAAIQQRGVLRVGVRSMGLPWAYRDRSGRWRGYDIDLLQALAQSLQVRLDLQEAPLPVLEQLLRRQQLDLAVGGIQTSPARAARLRLSEGYQTVHLALVVPDDKVELVQDLDRAPLSRPLVVAVTDPLLLNAQMQDQIDRLLGAPDRPTPIRYEPITDRRDFFTAAGGRRFDALLTTAEGGAAWAVLYPGTTMLPVFGTALQTELVVLLAGQDRPLEDYLNYWITNQKAQGFFARLDRHWIRANQ